MRPRRRVPPRTPRRWSLAALAVVASVALAGCGTAADRPDDNSAAAPGIGAAPGTTDEALGGVATEQAPIYWVGTGDQSGYLFREFRNPEDTSTADPVARAAAMVTRATPMDPDYRTLWSPVSTVGTSVSPDGIITVDLPAAAFGTQLSEKDAQMALQQMVYTVSAAAVTAGLLEASTAKEVRILVDGRTGFSAFGSVDLSDPLTRDTSLAAPVWLIDPQTDADPGSPLTVFLRVLPAVHDVRWEVTQDEGTVRSGTVAAASPGSDPTVGTELRTTIDLDPGEYTVRVAGTNDQGTVLVDDHVITVAATR
ncbi:GerMN domain-containing protein [Kocuria salsicia]|uniref:GerMN domain-containing protein n=1 Tax=Kocuria salsicia TaxID=664639 RepID=UPI0021B618A5|nr:GerMN domain-containing protein [Kocuria salsicia]